MSSTRTIDSVTTGVAGVRIARRLPLQLELLPPLVLLALTAWQWERLEIPWLWLTVGCLFLLLPLRRVVIRPTAAPPPAEAAVDPAPSVQNPGRNGSLEIISAPLRAAVDTLEDGIFLLDERRGFIYANYAVSKMVGYSPRELTGMSYSDLMTGEPSDEVFEAIRQRLDNREVWHGELVVRHRHGHLVALELVMTPLPNSTDGRRIYAGLQRDIINRKRLEERQERYAQDLERIAAERTADLVQLNEQLQEESRKAQAATQAKSRFLANMSHEIRTPLNAIIGFTDILLAEELSSEQAEYVDIVSTSSRALLELINDILDFSKIEAGEMKLSPTALSLEEQLRSCWLQFRKTAEQKGIELTWEVEENIPAQVVCDPMRLHQILNNLVSNALKFTQEGFVRFGAHLGEEEDLVIYVQDSGIGIDAEYHAEVFNAFHQGDDSTSRRFGGTGLGLAITRKLVEMLGGSITFSSAPASGSTFRVRLPLNTTEPQLPTETGAAAESALSPSAGSYCGLILIAEDNPHNYRLLESILKKAGHDTLHAWNGEEALELYERYRQEVGLIVMDMQLPVMDGYTATAALRELQCRVPIVAVTAYALRDGVGGRSDRERCLASGCDDYLTKPIEQQDFLALVDHYLTRPIAIDTV